MWTDNPLHDFHRHDAEKAREFEKLPECSECGEKIQDETCYQINYELVCEKCLENYKVWTDDFMR